MGHVGACPYRVEVECVDTFLGNALKSSAVETILQLNASTEGVLLLIQVFFFIVLPEWECSSCDTLKTLEYHSIPSYDVLHTK